jgi:hypothetical protein
VRCKVTYTFYVIVLVGMSVFTVFKVNFFAVPYFQKHRA